MIVDKRCLSMRRPILRTPAVGSGTLNGWLLRRWLPALNRANLLQPETARRREKALSARNTQAQKTNLDTQKLSDPAGDCEVAAETVGGEAKRF